MPSSSRLPLASIGVTIMLNINGLLGCWKVIWCSVSSVGESCWRQKSSAGESLDDRGERLGGVAAEREVGDRVVVAEALDLVADLVDRADKDVRGVQELVRGGALTPCELTIGSVGI